MQSVLWLCLRFVCAFDLAGLRWFLFRCLFWRFCICMLLEFGLVGGFEHVFYV